MRLKVTLQLQKPVTLPTDHQYLLARLVGRFLSRSETDYSAWAGGQDGAFRLYAFSPIRSRHRRVEGDSLWLGAGTAEWLLSSPLKAFLDDFAQALRSSRALEVGRHVLSIGKVEAVPEAELGREARLTCLAPIVAPVEGAAEPRYLPPDDPAFAEALRTDLVRKHRALFSGAEPPTGDLSLVFEPEYLATHRLARTVEIQGARVRGAFAPFTAAGSPELIRIGYQCGFGGLNAEGFGMVAEDRANP